MRKVVPLFLRAPNRCPANVLRSSMYCEKRDKLPSRSRDQLATIEAKLFSDLADGNPNPVSEFLIYPQYVFDCPQGKVDYYFSEEKKKYVLTDFYFKPGGGGGVSWSLKNTSSAYFLKPSCNDDFEDLVARSGWMRDCTGHLRRLQTRFWAWRDKTAHPSIRPDSQLAGTFSLLSALDDLDGVRSALFPSGESNSSAPKWSLLAQSVVAPEQLKNAFARSIIFGEMTCRLSDYYLQAHSTWASRRFLPSLSRELYDYMLLGDIKNIMDIACTRRPPESLLSTAHLSTAPLVDADLLTDRRRLQLVKSEMTLRMAESLLVKTRQYSQQVGCSTFTGTAEHQQLIRKFSLLADFVRISNEFFEVQETLELEDVNDMLCAHDHNGHGDEISHEWVILVSFGQSTSFLVDWLWPGDSLETSKTHSGMTANERLVSLASEILGVSRAEDGQFSLGI